ncbi:MAG: hypothetical protein KDE35_01205 [Geminicoccaceae bacterium]|nr:hypothetical protein [Geminicoccaceae bacterium]
MIEPEPAHKAGIDLDEQVHLIRARRVAAIGRPKNDPRRRMPARGTPHRTTVDDIAGLEAHPRARRIPPSSTGSTT